jgi:hypothetical protein
MRASAGLQEVVDASGSGMGFAADLKLTPGYGYKV